MSTTLRILLSGIVVMAAVAVAAVKYWDYVINPWTRDGQVRAQVVQITPRVSGPLVKLPIVDNQFVKAGDLLFEIDPRTFAATLDQERAELDKTRDEIKALGKQVEAAQATVKEYDANIKQWQAELKGLTAQLADAKADFERYSKLVTTGAASKERFDRAKADFATAQAKVDSARAQLRRSQASKAQAEADQAKAEADRGAPGERNARLRAAKAAARKAELDLEFTQVRAPVDGYVTNLVLRLGDQAVSNKSALALVDVNSFWIHGFFKENYIEDIRPGDRAIVTLMTYSDRPLEGRVDSVGWGIAQKDGSTSFDLLPTISPTFEWIRLAQRVPVRIHLIDVPKEVKLRVGTTASVLVMTGTSGSESKKPVAAAPRALQ